ncbi:helix-turn-helix transcriptional regulator [soil metagenome]
MTTPDRVYSALLERVYQAALEPWQWPDVLALSTDWLGARRALMFTPDAGFGDGGFFYSHGVSAEEMALWNSRHVGEDFWTSRTLAKKLDFEGSVILDGDLSSRHELLASDYYREHLSRMQIAWLLASVVLRPLDRSLPWVACSFYRGPDDSGFDETSREKMQLLLPHISRALGVMFRLRAADIRAASSAAALDALSFGVVLLNAAGKVVQSNLEAEQIWLRGEAMTCTDDNLQMRNPAAQRAWSAALRATLGAGGVGRVSHFSEVLRAPDASGGAYLLQMSRLPETGRFGALDGRARSIVFITQEHRKLLPSPEVLQRLYNLTPAEIRCVQALGTDKLEQAADVLGLSPHTVRTQLKNVYAKTGCDSRADLTRLLLSLASIS